MRDVTWIQGMQELLASFPAADQDPDVTRVRGEVYRRELVGLSDEAWLFAVSEAIRNERWFPTVAALLEYADSAGAPRPVAGLLEAPVRTEEERERAREVARQALDKIKAIVATIPAPRPRTVYQDPAKPVVVTDERMDQLREQGRRIVEEEARSRAEEVR